MKFLLPIILFACLRSIAFSQNSGSINNLNIDKLSDFSEFENLDEIIKDKKYIFLGESTHYGHEYTEVKYKLIKYLHEKHNFTTLLFESGMADCFYGNSLKDDYDSVWLMKHSVYSVWWSKPLISLMDYVKQNNLTIGGFDYQTSSPTSSSFLKLLPDIDSELLNETYLNDSIFSKFVKSTEVNEKLDKRVYDSIKSIANVLIRNYTAIDQIIATRSNKDLTYKNYNRIIANRLFLLNNFDNPKKMSPLRDSVMAANLLWVFDSLYPQEKVIIWGANDHIAKQRSNFGNGNYYAGSVLPDRIKNQSYYMGLYSFSGELYNHQSGKFTMEKPTKRSLEGRLHAFFGTGKSGWIDLNSVKKKRKFKWVNKPITSYALGKYPVKIIPVKYYDGIILIDKLSINKY